MFTLTVAPGIELRLFRPEDAEEVFAIVNRSREYLREWLPWVDYTESPNDVRNFIQRVHSQYEANQGPQAALWVDGRIAGGVGCHPIDWPNRHCSIGYWLEASHSGRGIITRACASLLDYLFDELGVHRVTIQCGTGNTRAVPSPSGWVLPGKA